MTDLQIARDNTARRTEVETNEERQNRLQLLQQNSAMLQREREATTSTRSK